jgi:hypothetical protein
VKFGARIGIPSEDGSAIIEFLIFGLAVNLALLGFGLEILQVQKYQLATESIARNSARSLAVTLDLVEAKAVAMGVAAGFELSPDDISINLECVPVDCFSPDALAVARVFVSDSRAQAVMPVSAISSEVPYEE